jgi:AcrR family transcriptional regulator
MAARPAPRKTPDDKREAILAAALELMNERTFGGTPMPLVAERAGVGAGTIYRYFESKEALANAVFRQCKLAMKRCLAEGAGASGEAAQHRASARGVRAEFHGLWRGLFQFLAEHPAACRFLETQQHAGYLDAASRRISTEVFDHVAGFVRRGQAAGALRAGDPALLIALAFGAFVGLLKEADAGHVRLGDGAIDESEEAVWALLQAPRRRREP